MKLHQWPIVTVDDVVAYVTVRQAEQVNPSAKIVALERAIGAAELVVINDYFSVNKDAKLALAINYGNDVPADKIGFLNVLEHLPEVEKLSIVVSGGKMLEGIEAVASLTDLKEFQLSGFYKKTVVLKPLEKFSKLNALILDWGVNATQQKIIKEFSNLTLLSLQTLDLRVFDRKPNLRTLSIGHSIKDHNKLEDVFPNITSLHLTKCDEVNNFDFISKLVYLEELTLREMVHLVSFPGMTKGRLRKIKLINAIHLESIATLDGLNAIEKLAITGIRKLKATDFKRFESKPTLKTLYTQFDDGKESSQFDLLANRNGWINSMLYW